MRETASKLRLWRKRMNATASGNILVLSIKIIITFLIILLLNETVFGVYRCCDDSMSPGIGEGDLVFTYHLDKIFASNDLTVYEWKGESQVRRVVAVGGDTVDIGSQGLIINGNLQSEPDSHSETLAYAEGISFPLTLKKNEVFLLADRRENATDSRYYGPVNIDDTRGMVMAALKHNGL